MTAAIARKHDAATDTFECTSCGQFKPRADYTRHAKCLYGLNSTCKSCNRLKSQKRWAETREAQRAKRAALAPVAVTPKTKPEQRPLYKAGAPSPKTARVEYPKDDLARCVFPGMPCEAQEGFALAHDLFAANSCMGIVRGFFATTEGKDAVGIVTPFFARKESAALWNAMVKNRYGRIDERRAA
jgi:hypothetical protein